MVHLVWDQLARTADYVVDLHGGDLEEDIVEFSLIGLTGHARVDQDAEALALALGMPIAVFRTNAGSKNLAARRYRAAHARWEPWNTCGADRSR